MLRRLILSVLIACLAFPAAAMPFLHARMGHGPEAHQTMAMPAHHHAMPASHHDDGTAGTVTGSAHECIGCMARYDGVALPEVRFVPVELASCIVAPAQVARIEPGPETPPPRC